METPEVRKESHVQYNKTKSKNKTLSLSVNYLSLFTYIQTCHSHLSYRTTNTSLTYSRRKVWNNKYERESQLLHNYPNNPT